MDYIDVTPLSVPDETWHVVDAAGHEHRWEDGIVPTIMAVIDVPATDEYPAHEHYECRLCGERITPQWTTPQFRKYMRVGLPDL